MIFLGLLSFYISLAISFKNYQVESLLRRKFLPSNKVYFRIQLRKFRGNIVKHLQLTRMWVLFRRNLMASKNIRILLSAIKLMCKIKKKKEHVTFVFLGLVTSPFSIIISCSTRLSENYMISFFFTRKYNSICICLHEILLLLLLCIH